MAEAQGKQNAHGGIGRGRGGAGRGCDFSFGIHVRVFGSIETKSPATFRGQGGGNSGLNYSSRCPQIRHAGVTNRFLITTKRRCAEEATVTVRKRAVSARDIWLHSNIAKKLYDEMAACQYMKIERRGICARIAGTSRLKTSGCREAVSGRGLRCLKFVPDKTTPDLIRLPDRMQIALGFCRGDMLMQDAMKIGKGRDAHVGCAMDKYAASSESFHHSTERVEIPGRGRFEIHGDMDIRHAETSNDAALIGKSIVGSGKSQIDDGLEPGLANQGKLVLGRLPRGAEFFADGPEIVNPGQRWQ